MSFPLLPEKTIDNQAPLEASKWLKIQVLLNPDEMESLLNSLKNCHIFLTSGVMKKGSGSVSREAFLQVYNSYFEELKKGQFTDEGIYRSYFSSAFTLDPEALYTLPIANDQQLIRVQKPVVQLQLHRMIYSPEDGSFHPMVFGTDSIPWGIQFSYPQLYRDPQTKQVEKVIGGGHFPNTQLFRSLQQWIRSETIPTPFLIGEKQINAAVRLGKKCLPWINGHPHLIRKGIHVAYAG